MIKRDAIANLVSDADAFVDDMRTAIRETPEQAEVVARRVADALRSCGLETELPSIDMQTLLDGMLDAVVIVSVDGMIKYFNSAAEETFGFSRTDVVGKNVNLLMPNERGQKQFSRLSRYARCGTRAAVGFGREFTVQHKSGKSLPLYIQLTEAKGPGGREIIAVGRDVTEEKRKDEHIQRLVYTDAATGMPNDSHFLESLHGIIEEGAEGFIATIELHGIGDLTGTFGVEAADLIIYELSKRLSGQMVGASIAARAGHRRFKVLYVANGLDERTKKAIAERLFHITSDPVSMFGGEVHLGLRMGVAMIRPGQSTASSLLKESELALQESARLGPNGFVHFSDAIEQKVRRRAEIVQRLDGAIASETFQLYFQPQIDLQSGGIIGCEALIRWQVTDGEWISPAEFIPIAEASGLIGDITEWTVEEASRIGAAWLADLGLNIRIGVNVSAEELVQPDFHTFMASVLQKTGLPPENIEVEITETALMKDVSVALRNLRNIREIGVTIALDDFGTGQSSLAYLKQFPIDRLKIDQSFVKNAPQDTSDQEIISTVVRLAHALNMSVIAEGAEEPEHVNLLKALGCDEVQGYAFAKPMPSKEFVEYCRAAVRIVKA